MKTGWKRLTCGYSLTLSGETTGFGGLNADRRVIRRREIDTERNKRLVKVAMHRAIRVYAIRRSAPLSVPNYSFLAFVPPIQSKWVREARHGHRLVGQSSKTKKMKWAHSQKLRGDWDAASGEIKKMWRRRPFEDGPLILFSYLQKKENETFLEAKRHETKLIFYEKK